MEINSDILLPMQQKIKIKRTSATYAGWALLFVFALVASYLMAGQLFDSLVPQPTSLFLGLVLAGWKFVFIALLAAIYAGMALTLIEKLETFPAQLAGSLASICASIMGTVAHSPATFLRPPRLNS